MQLTLFLKNMLKNSRFTISRKKYTISITNTLHPAIKLNVDYKSMNQTKLGDKIYTLMH
jgi:hypothetical protein